MVQATVSHWSPFSLARMKKLHSYLCLILGVFVTTVTCKRPKAVALKDVIWYPVEEEEGVFISIYGEKYSSKYPHYNTRESRSALGDDRHEGFSHHRRHHPHHHPISSSLIFIPTDHYGDRHKRESFENSKSRTFRFTKKPFLNLNFGDPRMQNVFDLQNNKNNLNNYFNEYQISTQEFPVSFAANKWTRKVNFVGRPVALISNIPKTPFRIEKEHSSRPSHELNMQANFNIYQYQGGSFYDEFAFKRPLNQITPHVPPNQSLLQNSFDDKRQIRPFSARVEKSWSAGFRPNTGTQDAIVFPEENHVTRPPTIPTFPETSGSGTQPEEPATMSPCERRCPVTPEYNPVCASDSVTYNNIGRLKCAQNCGKAVRLVHYGTCRNSRLAMPPRWTRS